MSGTSKKKSFPWRYVLVMALVVGAVVRMIWVLPRRGWSLEVQQTSKNVFVTAKEVRSVVLVSIDTCRADHLGCYGYSRKTSPNIDALAAEGILFNHAIAPVPITLPSHASMLTGTTPLYHRVRDNNSYRLAGSNETLAEILRANGFETAAVVGAFVLDSRFGLDQGFDTYDDQLKPKAEPSMFYNERSGRQVSLAAREWLEKHYKDRFFLFLHYFDPHAPYKFHEDFPFSSFYFVSFTRDRYDSEIAYADYCIGQVVGKLKDLGLYDSTLLIVTSDHGEGLGEHSERTHAYFIYHSTLHVPLIMRIPAGPQGVRIQETVGLIDIVPTVCGILGIRIPANVQGKDLGALICNNGDSFKNRHLYCESLTPTKFDLGPLFGLVGGRWKYIHTSEPELYDLGKDPYEKKNLLNRKEQQARIMQDRLRQVLKSADITGLADSKMVVDEETRARLESLGYVAGQAVDDRIQFEQRGLDPKEFIESFNFFGKFNGLISAGKIDKAKELCNEMLKKWPDMPSLHYSLGMAAAYEKDPEATIPHFSRYLSLVESEPDDYGLRVKSDQELANAHGNLGVAFNYKGETEKAKEHLKTAVNYDPDNLKYLQQLALICYTTGAIDDAVTYYTKAVDLAPDSAEGHFCLGNALFQQGTVQEAIIHYNKALELRPGWAEALEKLRMARAQKN